MSVNTPRWLEQVLNNYNVDAGVQNLLKKIEEGDDSVQEFSVQDVLIRKARRIWVGTDASIRDTILQSVHDSAMGGHSGAKATYQRLRRNFAWVGMKRTVEEYVDRCNVCKQAKSERVKYPGLLQPLPIACQA